MKKEILTDHEIIEQTEIEADLLQQLVWRKLIKPTGTTDHNVLIFDKQTMVQIREIEQFLRMGYSLEDIERILKKVGLPSTKKIRDDGTKKIRYLTVGELANQVNVNPRTIKYWEERGIIEPDTRSEGGFRLYADYWIYLCNLIKDLQLFGYSLEEIKETSELFRDFLAIKQSLESFPYEEAIAKLQVMQQRIRLFFDKMNQFKAGINRWEELLKKKEKEIRQFEHKLKQLKDKKP